jgi:site-specific recombinase XerD
MKTLRYAVKEYINIRRGLGYKLKYESNALNDFVSFLEQEGSNHITTKLALSWSIMPKNVQPNWWARRLSMVRNFAKYMNAIDPKTEIPPLDLLPFRKQRPTPYIFTNEEIIRILDAAKNLPPATGLRRWTYYYFFGLLSVTGLRLSEAINLGCEDVDLCKNILSIRDTKFTKSRLVPIHTTTSNKLKEYTQRRDTFFKKRPSNSFFVSENGKSLKVQTVLWTFRKISKQLNLKTIPGSTGPRTHSFRHAFTIDTLMNWYRSGMDVEQCMTRLSTYLGHTCVTNTYWYLSAVPELLALTTALLEKREEELS